MVHPVAMEGQQSPGGGTRPVSRSMCGALGRDRNAMSTSAFHSVDSTESTPRRVSESNMVTLPPVVRLESDDLLQIEITEAPIIMSTEAEQTLSSSVDSREGSSDGLAKDEKDNSTVEDKFAAVINQEYEDDIVFQAAVRKPKKKKKGKHPRLLRYRKAKLSKCVLVLFYFDQEIQVVNILMHILTTFNKLYF
jgi:hypothetical protein